MLTIVKFKLHYIAIHSIFIEIKDNTFSKKLGKSDFNPAQSASLFERHSSVFPNTYYTRE